MIPYEAQWDFFPDLVPILHMHDALRLMGRFTGRQPEQIAEFSQIRYLYLSRYPAIDLDILSSLRNLEILELDLGKWTSLDGIQSLASLRSLHLTECRKLVDPSALVGCALLRVLDFTLCSKVADLEWLQELKSLGYFRIEGKSVEDLHFVNGLPALEMLTVSARIKSRDLRPLITVPRLRRFCTSRSNVTKPMLSLLHQDRPDCEVVVW